MLKPAAKTATKTATKTAPKSAAKRPAKPKPTPAPAPAPVVESVPEALPEPVAAEVHELEQRTSRTVMTLTTDAGESVTFHAEGNTRTLVMAGADWTAMDKPRVVTVTVEPGAKHGS